MQIRTIADHLNVNGLSLALSASLWTVWPSTSSLVNQPSFWIGFSLVSFLGSLDLACTSYFSRKPPAAFDLLREEKQKAA